MMHRQKLLLAVCGIATAAASHAQSPPTSLKFEVASLKPSQPDPRGFAGIRPAPGGERYVASNVTLKLMITVAYRIQADQVAGGPGWMDTERYDMNAKAEGPSSVEELHLMLQDLLADRFKLRFHRETKELPVYALLVDKGGVKLQPHQAKSAGDPWIDVAFEQSKMAWHAKFAPMAYFAWRLSLMLDRPVIDQTGLNGGYDFDLAFAPMIPAMPAGGPTPPEGALLNGAPIDSSGPTIFDAVRQQLGLKLERQKGPVDILVIDHAEKPVEN
jgi:uncharacterized protein (TIGR03435 family)